MIIVGDAYNELKKLKPESVDCVITSPPYWALRDYGVKGQLGLEKTPELFVKNMVKIFRQVRRVLKPQGTLWLNLGDSYANRSLPGGSSPMKRDRRKLAKLPKVGVPAGLKAKDLIGIPWRVAFALQADGWYLRQDIIWHKPNPMPESVTDRCTKAHEYVFLLTKSPTYYYDVDAIRVPGKNPEDDIRRMSQQRSDNKSAPTAIVNGLRPKGKSWHDHKDDLKRGNRIAEKENHPNGANRRSVWSIPTAPFKEAHFATFPEKLIEPMVLAGCPTDGTVLDPFFGAGTTGVVAFKLKRNFVGIELNRKYVAIAKKRLSVLTIPML